MKYKPVRDGQLVSPRMRGYRMMCCDCGLVHRLNFRVVRVTSRKSGGYWFGERVTGHKVTFTAYRDERATAATRRRRKRK